MVQSPEFKYAPSAHVAADWQKAMTKHLTLFEQVCKDNDIQYFVDSGGLLGAIRHKSFIPWDNDVDVCVTEENYKKLQKAYLDGKFPEGVVLADKDTEEQYPILFGRFIDTNTSCPLSTSAFNGGKHGIFLDVFILFGVPEDENQQREAIEHMLVWDELLCYLKHRHLVRSEGFIEKWNAIKELEAREGHAAALAKAEANFRSYIPKNPKLYVPNSGGAYLGYPVKKAEWFTKEVYVPFADIQVPVPANYLEVLQRHYGASWRIMPDDGKFKAYAAADLCIPSEVVREDYMQFIDEEQCDADFRAWNDACMEELLLENAYIKDKKRMIAECIGGHLNSKCCSSSTTGVYGNLGQLAKADARDLLLCRNQTYFLIAEQMRGDFKKWYAPLHIDPKSIITAAWAYALTREDFWVAKKYLQIERFYKKMDRYWSSENAQKCLGMFDSLDKLYVAIDRKDTSSAKEALAEIEAINKHSLHGYIAQAFLLLQSEPDKCIQLIDDLHGEYLLSEYLQLFRAMALVASGATEQGLHDLCKLEATTRNGMFKLVICDFLLEKGLQPVAISADEIAEAPARTELALPQIEDLQSMRMDDYGWRARVARTKTGRKRMEALKGQLAVAEQRKEELTQKILDYRAIRRVTDARIMAWEKVYPRRSTILELAATGEMDEAFRLSRPLVRAAFRLYNNSQLSVTIDREIEAVIAPKLKEEWGEEFFEGWKAGIPAAYAEEDFADMLKRKGVNHPYFND